MARAYAKRYDLDFSKMQREFDTVLRALIHKVEREPRRSFSPKANVYLLISLLSVENTSRTVRYLAADTPRDPDRRPNYLLSIPPLNRTILDSVFNLLYIFEDVATRLPAFHKAGWREQQEYFQRLVAQYSDYEDWADYLARLKEALELSASEFQITPKERADPTIIDKWPNPGQMPTFRISSALATPTREFLQYLNDWYYREASQDSHLSSFSATRHGAFILHDVLPAENKEQIESSGYRALKANHVGRTLTLTLAHFSEVEAILRYGLNQRLAYLWGFLGNHIPETQEIYNRRYEELLKY